MLSFEGIALSTLKLKTPGQCPPFINLKGEQPVLKGHELISPMKRKFFDSLRNDDLTTVLVIIIQLHCCLHLQVTELSKFQM